MGVTKEDKGFEFLERKYAEIIIREPFAKQTIEQRYDNLDLVWEILEKKFFEEFNLPVDKQQSWNNNNGYFYEKVILDYLNSSLEGKGIAVYNMGKRAFYKMPKETKEKLKNLLKVTVVRKCLNQRYQLKSDIELDLLAVDTETCAIICSITCKTRFRERVYQPLYASRHLASVRSVFVTMDRDKNLKTCENPSDKRALLEAYMDTIFVNSSNKSLGFCTMVHPFREVVPTLLKWKSEKL